MISSLFFLTAMMISSALSSSSSSSSREIKLTVHPNVPTQYQLLHTNHMYNTPAFLLRKQGLVTMNNNKNIKNMEMRKMKRKKIKKMKKFKSSSRPFSAMLPKGFFPPSGSSPCHNDNPKFVAFYCHLTSPKP